jgi:hypothetical protein
MQTVSLSFQAIPGKSHSPLTKSSHHTLAEMALIGPAPQFGGKSLNFWSGMTLLAAGIGSFMGQYGMNHWTRDGQARVALNQQVQTIQTLEKLSESKKNTPREADYQLLIQKEMSDMIYMVDQDLNAFNGRPQVQQDNFWKQLGLKVDEIMFTKDVLAQAKNVHSLKDAEALYDQWADRVLVKVVSSHQDATTRKAEAKVFFESLSSQNKWDQGLYWAMLAGLGLGSPLALASLFQKKGEKKPAI